MTSVDLVITGGTVVNDSWRGPATVVVAGGRVVAVIRPDEAPPDARRAVDAGGCLVVPGGVDPHTHIGMSLGDYTTLDGYREATTAALWGGTTTVVDFAIPRPGESPLEAVRARRTDASNGVCDAALHACVVEWDDTIPGQLTEIARLGVRTVKLFTTYRDVVMAEPDTVLRTMQLLRSIGGLAYVHAEADHLIAEDQHRAAERGAIDAAGHAGSRSELAELAAVEQVLATARATDAPVYFVHQSTPAAIDAVRRARLDGVRAYTETCPHYLTLDAGAYATERPELYVCCPPLRQAETVAGVLERALTLQVDTIGSDHCCYDTEQKRADRHDVRVMPNGMPGVETRLPVVFDELVRRRGLPVERFVALTSTNPARLNGLYPRKGVIAPGADADLVVLDPTEQRTVRAADLHMATDYSPYEGRVVTGWPVVVVRGGRVVMADGEMVSDLEPGRALASAPLQGDQLIC